MKESMLTGIGERALKLPTRASLSAQILPDVPTRVPPALVGRAVNRVKMREVGAGDTAKIGSFLM